MYEMKQPTPSEPYVCTCMCRSGERVAVALGGGVVRAVRVRVVPGGRDRALPHAALHLPLQLPARLARRVPAAAAQLADRLQLQAG